MEKVKMEIPVVLPENGECEQCIARLQERLVTHKGVSEAHIDRQQKRACLCLHYHPNLISLRQVEDMAQAEGVAIERRYRHRILNIGGMDCADCARTLEKGVADLEGVIDVAVNFAASTMRLEYDAQLINERTIEKRIRQLGYEVAKPAPLVFQLEGLDCPDCAVKLEKAVGSLSGVKGARVNFTAAKMKVIADDREAVIPQIIERVRETGYQASLEGKAEEPGLVAFITKRRRDLMTALSGLTILAAFVLEAAGMPISVTHSLYGVAILLGGYYVAKSGLAAVRTTRSPDMNFLMTIAVVGAMAIGEWEEGALVVFLFSLGNMLESYTMDRARNAIRALMDLSPQEATLIHNGHEERVPVEQLRVGDLILVKPGERIPMDGRVIEGTSAVNQAPITGESIPVDKGVGAKVYAGSINGQGALTVRVTRLAQDNTLSRIVEMVEEAQAQKAPSQRFVDRFARYYTPAVIAGAVFVATLPPLFTGAPLATWFYRALVLLVIACPCALVISTPVSIVSAIASAARNGVLVKGGAYLEEAGALKVVAFDKTGTLTEGRPAVTEIIPFNGHSEEEVLALAASVESRSEHPLAQAIVREARHRGLGYQPGQEFEALTGRGARARVDDRVIYVGNHELFEALGNHPAVVCDQCRELEAEGKTAMLVGSNDEVVGLIAVADTVRETSHRAVAALKRMGVVKTLMLTGDNEGTARAIARQAGIDEFRANLLPEEKVSAIESLLEEHGKVAMVGDGVNDAPALAKATVGIAMGAAGTDTALETADIALMADDLSKLPFAMWLSRRTLSIVRQNIALALAIKATFLALALPGLATLWMAVFADMGASLIVICNGMRLLRVRDREK